MVDRTLAVLLLIVVVLHRSRGADLLAAGIYWAQFDYRLFPRHSDHHGRLVVSPVLTSVKPSVLLPILVYLALDAVVVLLRVFCSVIAQYALNRVPLADKRAQLLISIVVTLLSSETAFDSW